MSFTITIGGQTFTEANFAGFAYADETAGFPMALQKMVEHVANAFRGTATDSVTVGAGAKLFTITNANGQIPAFDVGMPVRVARTADPSGTYMQGEITAWNPTTGATTINVSSKVGSGTFTDWTITVGGYQTLATASPLGLADGGTGAATAPAALANLGAANHDNIVVDANGIMSLPTQPAFLATLSINANVTGDGTNATVSFINEIKDANNDYDGTNTLTAPVPSAWAFSFAVTLDDIGASHVRAIATLVTSNRTYSFGEINAAAVAEAQSTTDRVVLKGSVDCADMDDNDTAVVKINVFGSSKVIDLEDGFFSGHQLLS
jgi:hypothetical protein